MDEEFTKYYIKKFRANKENYKIAAYEYLYLNKKKRIGKVINHFSEGVNKYLQGDKYVENLKFTIKEIISQF